MHGYLPERKLHFVNCIAPATLLPPDQMLPLLSTQPLRKAEIKSAVSQPQQWLNHQQLCHKNLELSNSGIMHLKWALKWRLQECVRVLPMLLSHTTFPDFFCVQGLQIRNCLIPALPLVSPSVKKAVTICHEGYKHTFVPATKKYLISASVTTALHRQVFGFIVCRVFSLSYLYINIIE